MFLRKENMLWIYLSISDLYVQDTDDGYDNDQRWK
jgi:hypothetical protein